MLAPLVLSGCDFRVLDPAGPISAGDSQILVDSVMIMLAIVLPTIVAIAAFAWWFRASNPRAQRHPEFVYSGRVEMVVWSIPALTVLLLSGVIWVGSHLLDPMAAIPSSLAPLDVQVVSLDWKWLFFYPEQKIASVNQLVAPVGRPLRLTLTSGSVMTVFFVPRWGSMIYVMNGMSTRLNLQADKVGDYLGEAAHFSGDGFSNMRFDARAVTSADFDAWVQKSAAATPAFDADAYRKLEQQGLAPESAQALGDPNLYKDIVSQKIPPAPGPAPQPRPTAVGG